ncbi:MAG: C13 family peptidase [Oligoflexia bacterium]|nr:C13 family peptidase [Oligoflexia bacterium]
MTTMARSILIALLLLPRVGYTENFLYSFGGGDSENVDDVMFDSHLLSMRSFAKERNWRSAFFYRKRLPPSLSPEERGKIGAFNSASFEAALANIKRDIELGKIKQGDQLLIDISTHGGNDRNGNLTFQVDKEKVDARSLQSIFATAEKHGVKAALLGWTCYSGSLISYANQKTCVITASQADRAGSGGETRNFDEALSAAKTGANLEDLYLKTRSRKAIRGSGTQPMISTQAGAYVDRVMSPFRNVIFPSQSDLEEDFKKPICRNYALQFSEMEREFKRVSRSYYEILELAVDIPFVKGRLVRLRERVLEFQKLYESASQFFAFRGKELCTDSEPRYCFKMDQVEPLRKGLSMSMGNCGKTAGVYGGLYSSSPYAFGQDSCEKQKILFDQFTKILSNPTYLRYLKESAEYSALIEQVGRLSEEISLAERDLYDQLYRNVKPLFDGPNPCKEFRL